MGIKSAKAKKRQDKKQDKKLQFANGARPMVRLREDLQDYGRITKVLGGCRFSILLSMTNRETIGWLCGSLHRRGWLAVDSVVLVSIRDFQTDKVDIIHKYTEENVKQLLGLKEITPAFVQREDKWGRNGGGDTNDIFTELEEETKNKNKDNDGDNDSDSESESDSEMGKWPMTLEDMLPPPYEAYDDHDTDTDDVTDGPSDKIDNADKIDKTENEPSEVVVKEVVKVDKRHKKKGRDKDPRKNSKEDMTEADIDAI